MTAEARVLPEPWQVEYSADSHVGIADTQKLGVGGSAGPRPHELLEAALASCMTITARMALAELDIDDAGVSVSVEVVREPTASCFRYALALPRPVESYRATLMERLDRSPVRTTLSQSLSFVSATDGNTLQAGQ